MVGTSSSSSFADISESPSCNLPRRYIDALVTNTTMNKPMAASVRSMGIHHGRFTPDTGGRWPHRAFINDVSGMVVSASASWQCVNACVNVALRASVNVALRARRCVAGNSMRDDGELMCVGDASARAVVL
jgi:hypothetical protein